MLKEIDQKDTDKSGSGHSDDLHVEIVTATRLSAVPLQPVKAGSIEVRVKLEIHWFMAFRAQRFFHPKYSCIVMFSIHVASPDLLDMFTNENLDIYIFHWPENHGNPGLKNGLVLIFFSRTRRLHAFLTNEMHDLEDLCA